MGKRSHFNLFVLKRLGARKNALCPAMGALSKIGFAAGRTSIPAEIGKFEMICSKSAVMTGKIHLHLPFNKEEVFPLNRFFRTKGETV